MVTLGLSLLAIVAGLYLLVFLYNRFFGARLGKLGGTYPIKLLSSFHLGPKQRIVVLDVNGEIVACGVTPTQISFLTRLGGGATAGQRRQAPARPQRPAPARGVGSGGGQTTAAAAAGEAARARPAKPDPVQQFADALKEKVGSMKRIK
jgi:flagellar biogenesis protein FliO